MKFRTKIAIAAISLSLMGSGGAKADTILHYSFDPGSYFNLGGVDTSVTGTFDYNVTTQTLENVNYNRGGDIFTVGSLDYGPTQPIFGVFGSADYDVYQLNNSLALGGTDLILSGTHPAIAVYGAGVSVSTVGAVPEPTSWALMLLGFGAIGYAMRRRTRTTVAYA